MYQIHPSLLAAYIYIEGRHPYACGIGNMNVEAPGGDHEWGLGFDVHGGDQRME